MSTSYSPKIVTNGLVLYLDAANAKSFKGEPTTNLVSNPLRGFGNQSHMQVTTFDTTGPFNKTQNVARFSHTAADPRSGDQRAWTQFTLTDKSTPYTFSVYVYLEPGTEAQNTGQFWRVSQTDGSHWLSPFAEIISSEVHSWDIIGQWQRISVTFQPDPNNASNTFYVMYYNRVALGSGLVFTSGQLESKPYATPFVSDVRGASVLSGGGRRNLVNYFADSTLVNEVTYNHQNFGSLEFNGLSSRVNINTASGDFLDFTTSLSFCVRIRPVSSGLYVFTKNTTGGYADQQYGCAFESQRVRFVLSGDSNCISSVGSVPLNAWTHVAGTWDGSVQSLFINGKLDVERSFSSVPVFKPNLVIGFRNAGTTGHYFTGNINALSLYETSLTSDEVMQNFNATRGRYRI